MFVLFLMKCRFVMSNYVIENKISGYPRKCHNHAAQPSRGIKRRRDEGHIIIKQTSRMKPPTHKQKRTATEEPNRNGQ